jgi:ABC-type multidrug transport system fused ATPase/permease subunit
MKNTVKKIFFLLNEKDKKKFYLILILSIFSVFFETLGIGSFLPLIEYFTGSDLIGSFNFIDKKLSSFELEDKTLLIFLASLILIVFLIKNLYMAFFLWVETKFLHQAKANLIIKLHKKYVNEDYNFYINTNSSTLIANLNVETDVFANLLSYTISIIVESVVSIGILLLIFYINPFASIIVFLLSLFFCILLYFFSKQKTLRLGTQRLDVDKRKQKALQQTFGAIKEILIFNIQKYFINIFSSHTRDTEKFLQKFEFLNKLQKIWIEIFVVLLIVTTIYSLIYFDYQISNIMAILGVFLISAIKIVPSLSKIVTANNYLRYANPSLLTLENELKESSKKKYQESKNLKLPFSQQIIFKNVNFAYAKGEKKILRDVNLKVFKNEFIGVIGETGSGKSTFSDLFLGLIEPDSGQFLVDGENILENLNLWKKKIGYVPQNIYLLDDTIKKNIAIGIEEHLIDSNRINTSVTQASIENLIKKLPDGLNSIVGEKGVKISGGEKQRIGIARALYRNPEVLVFDEATSSLDLETESSILKSLIKLKAKKTIIFSTHRKSNLSICDRILVVENNTINEIYKK